MAEPTVLEITNVFLLPASVLIGALGVAEREGIKIGISAMCGVVAGLWQVSSYDAMLVGAELRTQILGWFPSLFIAFSIVSFFYHLCQYFKSPKARN
jgi:hypothetical protein